MLKLAIASALTLASLSAVSSRDNGQWNGLDPKTREWFRSLKSPSGIPCCDTSDGHRTTWRGTSEGGYEVPIEGEWRHVPPEAIIYTAGNPTGEAIVWYVRLGEGFADPIRIRCFVPGGGV